MKDVRLAVPLSPAQIAAAERLHARSRQWRVSDDALHALAQRFPDFGDEAVVLKCVAINALYGTNVFAITRMAEHVKGVIAKTDLASAGPKLVEQLAALPKTAGQKKARLHLSFASKFAHFFIDPGRFPILDNYAVKTLVFHLGEKNLVKRPGHPYMAFVENLLRLRTAASLTCSTRELDHYLWVAGEYRAYREKPNAKINVEMRSLFQAPSTDDKANLRLLLAEL
jgi:hypothetical protein